MGGRWVAIGFEALHAPAFVIHANQQVGNARI